MVVFCVYLKTELTGLPGRMKLPLNKMRNMGRSTFTVEGQIFTLGFFFNTDYI